MVSGIAIFNGKLEKVESVWVDEKSLHCIRDDMGTNCNETAESQKRLNDVRNQAARRLKRLLIDEDSVVYCRALYKKVYDVEWSLD